MLNLGHVGSLTGIMSDPHYRSYMQEYADWEQRGRKGALPHNPKQKKFIANMQRRQQEQYDAGRNNAFNSAYRITDEDRARADRRREWADFQAAIHAGNYGVADPPRPQSAPATRQRQPQQQQQAPAPSPLAPQAPAPAPEPQQKPAPAMSSMPRYAREQQVRNRLNPVGAKAEQMKAKAPKAKAKAKSASPKDRKAKEREARKLKAQQYAEDRAQRRKIIQDKVRVIPRQTGTQRNRNRVQMAHLPSDDLHRNRRLQSRMQMMQALGFA